MKHQQINLFQDCLVDRPEPWQNRQAWLVLFAVFCVCSLLALLSYRQGTVLGEQRDQLLRQVNEIRHAVELAEAQSQGPESNPLIEEKLRRIEEEMTRQKAALNYFSDQDVDSNGHIINSLEGLAKIRQEGLWLSRVHLGDSGDRVELAGSALTAESVPDYLELLSEHHVFGGRAFSHLQVTRENKRGSQVDFVLNSEREDR